MTTAVDTVLVHSFFVNAHGVLSSKVLSVPVDLHALAASAEEQLTAFRTRLAEVHDLFPLPTGWLPPAHRHGSGGSSGSTSKDAPPTTASANAAASKSTGRKKSDVVAVEMSPEGTLCIVRPSPRQTPVCVSARHACIDGCGFRYSANGFLRALYMTQASDHHSVSTTPLPYCVPVFMCAYDCACPRRLPGLQTRHAQSSKRGIKNDHAWQRLGSYCPSLSQPRSPERQHHGTLHMLV
jgi:hypothetical protein